LHCELQQTPVTQNPLEQAAAVVHAPPIGMAVLIGVAVGMGVGVLVGITVGVLVGVEVGIGVGLGVLVGIGVGLGVGVGVGVGMAPEMISPATVVIPLFEAGGTRLRGLFEMK
jgi:hypothetical protein